jgi:hypothetical protein
MARGRSRIVETKKGGSFLGGITSSAPFELGTNLVEDIKDAVVGIPTGIVMLAKDPIKTTKAIGESTWQTWSPLFSGDFKKFGEQAWDHPLAPLLDVLTVVTLGGAGAAKVATKVGGIEKAVARQASATRIIKGSDVVTGAPNAYKIYHNNPVVRARQKAIEGVVNRFATLTPAQWYTGGTKYANDLNAARALSGKELADLKRWTSWDKYDTAARAHAAGSARNLQLDAYALAAKRLNYDLKGAAAEVFPHIHEVARTHAFAFEPKYLIGEEMVKRSDIGVQTTKLINRHKRMNKPLVAQLNTTELALKDAIKEFEDASRAYRVKYPDAPPLSQSDKAFVAQARSTRVELASAERADARMRSKLTKKAQRYDDAKARYDRVLGRSEYELADFQHFGMALPSKLEHGNRGVQALKKRVQAELDDSVAARDKLEALKKDRQRAVSNADQAMKSERTVRAEAKTRSDKRVLDERTAAAERMNAAKAKIAEHSKTKQSLREQKDALDAALKEGKERLYDPVQNRKLRPATGFTYLRDRADYDRRVSAKNFGSVADYETYLRKQHTKDLTTRNARLAARDDQGRLLVVRDHSVSRYGEEAARSTHVLGKLGRGITTVWKYAVLALRPAFLVNNAVGNSLMYMLSSGPGAMRGFVDAMRQIHGSRATRQGLGRAERELRRYMHDWQDKYYLGLHRGFGKDTSEWMTIDIGQRGTKGHKAVRLLTTGLYDVTHRVSDTTLRRAYINDIMRRHPEVQALQKKGMHFNDAAEAVSQNRAVREFVQQRVNDALGQYHYLNPTERFIRAVVPFYTWDRAIARHGGKLFLEKPGTALALTEVGKVGTETTEELLGQIPDWLKGALPLSLLGFPEEANGRTPIATTQGFNPYATLEQLMNLGQAAITGKGNVTSAVASELHPALSGAIESLTGTSMLTGAPITRDDTGVLPAVAGGLVSGLPQVNLIKSWLGKTGSSADTLFAKDAKQYTSAYLGVPIKELNLKTAAAMAERADGKPKKKRRRGRSRG